MEETARYLFLLVLLSTLAKKGNRQLLAIILSSAIFSLLHILSFQSTGFNVNTVILNIIHAFGFGCILGFLFLYTGKLWLAILLHAFADFISYSLIPLGYVGSLMESIDSTIIFLVIITVVPLLFMIIMLTIHTVKKVANENISRLVFEF